MVRIGLFVPECWPFRRCIKEENDLMTIDLYVVVSTKPEKSESDRDGHNSNFHSKLTKYNVMCFVIKNNRCSLISYITAETNESIDEKCGNWS